jgi:hypothetical protein
LGHRAPMRNMFWHDKDSTVRRDQARRVSIDHIVARSKKEELLLEESNLRFMAHDDNRMRGTGDDKQ